MISRASCAELDVALGVLRLLGAAPRAATRRARSAGCRGDRGALGARHSGAGNDGARRGGLGACRRGRSRHRLRVGCCREATRAPGSRRGRGTWGGAPRAHCHRAARDRTAWARRPLRRHAGGILERNSRTTARLEQPDRALVPDRDPERREARGDERLDPQVPRPLPPDDEGKRARRGQHDPPPRCAGQPPRQQDGRKDHACADPEAGLAQYRHQKVTSRPHDREGRPRCERIRRSNRCLRTPVLSTPVAGRRRRRAALARRPPCRSRLTRRPPAQARAA